MTATAPAPAPAPSRAATAWWVGAAIVLVSLNLRPGVVGVGPVLQDVRLAQHLSATGAGVLTALPVLCFGVLAPVGPRLARRFGIERTLFGALVLLCAGFAVRSSGSLVALFAGTVLIGGAIAGGSTLLPGLIKRDFAHRVGLMTGLYTMAISAGAALGAGVTVPVARAAELGWAGALAIWGLLAVAALLGWLPLLRGRGHRGPASGGRAPALLRDRIAWQVTAFMGLQSLSYFAVSAWLPTLFVSRGADPATAGWLLALASGAGILTSLLTPVIAARRRSQTGTAVAATALTTAGALGVLLLPGLPWLGTIVLGLGQGATISLALTLIVLRSPDGMHAAQLSGMAQSVGFTLAAVGPLAFGALHDLSGGWTVPLVVLIVLLVPQAVVGAGAGRDRLVGAGRPGDRDATATKP